MPLGINTNLASLIAQRNLSGSADTLQNSIQRLSSGLRINSAKDDAAGLAISQRMTSQIRCASPENPPATRAAIGKVRPQAVTIDFATPQRTAWRPRVAPEPITEPEMTWVVETG